MDFSRMKQRISKGHPQVCGVPIVMSVKYTVSVLFVWGSI
jgi:hypothetical protein